MTRMASKFKVNRAGMARITRTLGRPAAVRAAERGKSWAEANSPVLTGEYKNSFVVQPANVGKDGRQGARLVNTSGHAADVEWGRGAKHVLKRSVDAIENS